MDENYTLYTCAALLKSYDMGNVHYQLHHTVIDAKLWDDAKTQFEEDIYEFNPAAQIMLHSIKAIDEFYDVWNDDLDENEMDSFFTNTKATSKITDGLTHIRNSWVSDSKGLPAMLLGDVIELIKILTDHHFTQDELMTEVEVKKNKK